MKIVQRIRNYLDINFHQGRVNGHEVMDVFVTVLTMSHFITSQRNLSTSIKVYHPSLLSENCSGSSKLFKYKFHQGRFNGHEVMGVFVTVLTMSHFLTSRRNLSTLIKANRPSLLSDNCSSVSKLLGYKFSSR